MNTNYQSRYLAYCKFEGFEPEQMLKQDKIKYPGACMCGFMLWIQSMWAKWSKENQVERPFSNIDHDNFDAWLDQIHNLQPNQGA